MYIQKSDMEKYGYTETCKGCRAQQSNLKPQAHSEACRQRIEREVRGDSTQAVRVEQFDYRQNFGVAEHVQEQRKAPNEKMQEERQDDRKDNEKMDEGKKEPETVNEPRKREFGESAMPSSSGGEMKFPSSEGCARPAKAHKK